MGYNSAKQFAKHKEDFGHGAIEGVCGSEAANNAVTGGSLIPVSYTHLDVYKRQEPISTTRSSSGYLRLSSIWIS